MNLALASLDLVYTFLELDRPVGAPEGVAREGARELSLEQRRRLLRIAEDASAKKRAIIVMLLYIGRLSELVALDVDDVRVRPRKGLVCVRSGPILHARGSPSRHNTGPRREFLSPIDRLWS